MISSYTYVQYIHYHNVYQYIEENLVQKVTQHMSLVMTTAVIVIMRKGKLLFTAILSHVWLTMVLAYIMIICSVYILQYLHS